MTATNIKRVAVIGAGPAGAITVDALSQEKTFDVIRVFERQEKTGGVWIRHPKVTPKLTSVQKVIQQQADVRVQLPSTYPALTTTDPKINDLEERYAYTPMHDNLSSNIDARIMSYTQEPFPHKLLGTPEIAQVDPNAPYRSSEIIREWVDGLFNRNHYRDLVEFSTTVELAEKIGKEWVLTLRKTLPDKKHNYWWQEKFDAVIVASGHYSIPLIPEVPGLVEFDRNNPGVVEHSKTYRGPEKYRGKTVVTIGASISAVDIAIALAGVAHTVYASVRTPHRVFGTIPFERPGVIIKPVISHLSTSSSGPEKRTVYFADGSKVDNVDHIIFGTGYDFSLPWLPSVEIRNRRILGTYLHIFKQEDPTLLFVGGVSAGFTFRVFEWQAVAAARFLAGRAKLPPLEVQKQWEQDRLKKVGDGQPFYKVAPDFEEYFEALRELAGNPGPGEPGRYLPKWDPKWGQIMDEAVQKRIKDWKLAGNGGNQTANVPLQSREQDAQPRARL